jgi:hypothetical protein
VGRKWYRNPTLLIALVLIIVLAWREHQLSDASSKIFGHDLQASQLSVPTRPPANGGYAFLNVDGHGQPVRFDPCHTIHYVVHVGAGPAVGVSIVQQGIAEVSKATGLHFHYDGMTSSVPANGRSDHPGDPVWIGWATAQQTSAFARISSTTPDAVGVGGPTEAHKPGGPVVYVGGSVILLPSNEIGPGFGPGPTEGNVLLHELGHLVGLAHVADPHEIMNPSTSAESPDGYNVGDLNGLYRLGSAKGCL